ncbi:nuclear factor 7, brain-like, partial [Astyanax mexicanus]
TSMDSRLSKQIQCSVCLGDFVDPVSLLCDHTFCRQCISNHSQSSRGLRLCPECRRPYTMWDLRSNRVLRNMVDAVREHLSEQQSLRDRGASAAGTDRTTTGPVLESEMLLCPEHDERLKLFCETDQQLVCLICRDGDNHQGHKFKPVDEAAGPKKVSGRCCYDHVAAEKEKSKQLSAQISAQFEEMHKFLREKEQKVKALLEKEEKAVVETMQKNKIEIEEKLNRGREEEAVLHSVLETDRPDGFLQVWILYPFKSSLKGLSVLPDSLFLGPYETHLQFFVWREMLGSIKPGKILRDFNPALQPNDNN